VSYGGAENAIDTVCRGLSMLGNDVYLWAAEGSTCPVTTAGSRAATDNAAAWHSAPEEADHVLKGYEWLDGHAVDVVEDHTYLGPLVGPLLTRAPVVAVNSLPFTPPHREGSHPDLSRIYAEAARRAHVVAISANQATGASTPVAAVLHHGTDFVEGTARLHTSAPEVDSYAAVLGRMSPDKGIVESIRAGLGAGLSVRIAARMEEPKELSYFRDEVVPLLDGDRVTYLGCLEHAERDTFLAGAVCLVNLAQWPEPFGLVTIESMAVGTPVVATRIGAAPELIEPGVTGFLVESELDAAKAVAACSSLDRSSVYHEARTRFGVVACARRRMDFYRGIPRSAGS
jgi:glycosyltransferase involved in cell wall biosynthesis